MTIGGDSPKPATAAGRAPTDTAGAPPPTPAQARRLPTGRTRTFSTVTAAPTSRMATADASETFGTFSGGTSSNPFDAITLLYAAIENRDADAAKLPIDPSQRST